MKKLMTLTLALAFASSLALAQRGPMMPPPADREGHMPPPHMMGHDKRPGMDREDFREKREEMMKDRKEMEALVDK